MCVSCTTLPVFLEAYCAVGMVGIEFVLVVALSRTMAAAVERCQLALYQGLIVVGYAAPIGVGQRVAPLEAMEAADASCIPSMQCLLFSCCVII